MKTGKESYKNYHSYIHCSVKLAKHFIKWDFIESSVYTGFCVVKVRFRHKIKYNCEENYEDTNFAGREK
jgi:hypothetical protein